MAEQSLKDSLWWIMPHQLAGMRKPHVNELEIVKAAGIGAIVSVMDDPSNLDLYEAEGIPYRWLPTKGGTAPTQDQVDEFRRFIDASLEAGLATAVHCSSGRRRTATFLGAYLILTGTRYEEAIAAIAQANPAVEMRDAQLNFLQSLGR
jgi:atypical dual specificity phosphatase